MVLQSSQVRTLNVVSGRGESTGSGRIRVVIVGNRGGTNVGQSIERVRADLIESRLIEAKNAMGGSRWLARLSWHFAGKRPARLRGFSKSVHRLCEGWRPCLLLTTGQAPVDRSTLRRIGDLGIVRANYLTDDPWNPAHHAPWFVDALKSYDYIFSTKRSVLDDLRRVTRASVHYLPFGYDPTLFHSGEIAGRGGGDLGSDVLFAGGADGDRIPYIRALRSCGVHVLLYGDYWERYPETREITRGHADPETLRRAIRQAKVVLCLVRRANRDGSCMRTFEVPAVGACMLTEDTGEHREIFGEEGAAVLYFRSADEMVDKVRWLLARPEERRRLAAEAHRIVTEGGNTYGDRLLEILRVSGAGGSIA